MEPITINIEDFFAEVCEGMNVQEILKWKEKANENCIEQGIKPGRMIDVFNEVIDSQIQVKQAQESNRPHSFREVV